MTSLNKAYTIGDQLVETYLLHRKANKAKASARAVELLQKAGITAALNRLARYPMSGGQCQRVAIAPALELKPEFVIGDEPTSALDLSVQNQIFNLLGDLRKEFGQINYFTFHYLAIFL